MPSPSTPHPLHTSYVLGPYTPQSLITPRHAYAAAAVLPRTQEEPFASITPLACSNQSGVYKWLETMVTHHVGGVTQVGEAGAAAAGTTGQAGANAAPAASGGASGMVAPLEEGQGAHTILDELPPGCLAACPACPALPYCSKLCTTGPRNAELPPFRLAPCPLPNRHVSKRCWQRSGHCLGAVVRWSRWCAAQATDCHQPFSTAECAQERGRSQ